MADQNKVVESKIPLFPIAVIFTLGLAFLKLVGLIDISWLLVLLPIGLVTAFLLVFLAIFTVFVLVGNSLKEKGK